MAQVAGIVLAAGAGTRAGGPKALRTTDGMPWVASAVTALREGGCLSILVVLGADAGLARPFVPADAEVVVAEDWAAGMSASLRAGLAAVPPLDAAVVTLVDLPGLPAAAVARLVDRPTGPSSLRRATYAGRPGHPVLLGSDHWAAIAEQAAGDRGAGPYLARHDAELIPCDDLWDGADLDGA